MSYRTPRIAALLFSTLALGWAISGCSEDTVTQPPTSNATEVKDSLSGSIKGIMKAGKTYFLIADARVERGDTLLIEPGVRLIAPTWSLTDSSVYTLFINGTLIAHGTRDQMIYMGPSSNRQFPGAWGGIQADSAALTSFKFVRIDYAGGLRPTGQPRPAIYWLSNAAQTSRFVMEDCYVYAPIDDGFMVRGGSGQVLRNTFEKIGVTHGAAMNFQAGFRGTVAYNYVYDALDQALQVQTSQTVPYPQTDLLIHNNTIVNSGFRNPARPGAGVIMNYFAKGKIYNNIFVNTRMGIRITKSADSNNIQYDNNLFYTTVDTLQQHFYPADAVGRPQTHDLIQIDPRFVKMPSAIGASMDAVDPRLNAGSPALGAGNATYDPDLGAYTAKR